MSHPVVTIPAQGGGSGPPARGRAVAEPRLRNPYVARAVSAPATTLLAGAAMAAGVLAGLPILGAAAVGAAAFGLRVALALPRKPQSGVAPNRLSDPWRRFVADALDARRRFDVACRRTRPGPLHDRLVDLGRRLDDAVQQCWRVAQQGDALVGGLKVLDAASARQQLDALANEPATPDRDRAEAALKGQLATFDRLNKVAGDAVDRLRALNAQLDEAVARAVELSLQAGDDETLSGVSSQVDSVVGDMEALRQALEETGGGTGGETGGTPAASSGGGA